MARKQWRAYDEAAAWAQQQGIRTVGQWRTRSKEPDFPEDLPPSPDNAYKAVFPGWGVFLGTGTVAPQNKTYRSYAESSAWAQAQGIRTQKEWQARSKDPDFPTDIPKNLLSVYKDEFLGLGDFLGTGRVAAQKRTYRPYEEASAWAHKQGLGTREAWLDRAQGAGFPSDLPADPRKVYGEQFQGWPAFLQSGRLSSRARVFRSMDAAAQWAQGEGITDREGWRVRAQAENFPEDLPKNPSETYGTAFSGWGEFLGTGRVANQNRVFRPYEEAAQWAQAQGITSALQWAAQGKLPRFPVDLPKDPAQVYGEAFTQGDGWPGFLGHARQSGSSKIEKALKRGLSLVLDLDPSSRAMVVHTQGQRPVSVDMVDRARRIVIEYDGWFWHHELQKELLDRRKTARLTQGEEPWTVIRVREAPLDPLHDAWDLPVPLPNGKFGPTIQRVMQHLRTLVVQGSLQDDGLVERIDRALGQTLHESQFNDLFQMGWRSCDQASAWAREQGITTHAQWRDRCNAPGFPDDLPKHPNETYGAAFRSWGEFLGTGVVASQDRTYRSYAEASAWAQAQGITSMIEWRQKRKTLGVTNEFPYNPDKVYKAEFRGWGTFLGTGTVAPQRRVFRSCEDAAQWAQKEGIANETQWRTRRKQPGFPQDIPKNPPRTYGQAFGSWGKFLGTGRVASHNRVYRTYLEAMQWTQEQGIASERDWRKACRQEGFPIDIPRHPQDVYRKQFTGWGTFLGTGRRSRQFPHYRSYEDVASWAREQGITTARQWQERSVGTGLPSDVPSHPERVYREFPGWGTFLDTGRPARAPRSVPVDEATTLREAFEPTVPAVQPAPRFRFPSREGLAAQQSSPADDHPPEGSTTQGRPSIFRRRPR